LFALTPQGYQNLSMNVSEMRRFMQQQQAIIAALKKILRSV
jgi:predicted transcriptional regulator